MQRFIDKMNEKSNYVVNKYYIDALIKNMGEEKDRIKIEFKDSTKIDIFDNKAVMKYVGIGKINKIALQEQFEKTRNINIDLVLKYRTLTDKLAKIKGFIENIKIEKHIEKIEGETATEREGFRINPVFKLNEKGAVTVSQPSIPLSMHQIQQALKFEYAIPFTSLAEIVAFLKEYKDLSWKGNATSTFLIISTTLYINILDNERDIMPFSYEIEEEAEVRKLIKEFYDKYKKYKLVEANFWNYPEKALQQQKEFWERDIAENKIEEKIELEIEKDIETANLEEKNEKNPEDIVDIKGQVDHIAETAEEETKKHYVSKTGNIEVNYTKKEIDVNRFDIAELFFESSSVEELRKNTYNFLNALTPTWSNVDNYKFSITGLKITATLEVELIETEEICTLTIENGQLNII